MRRVDVEPVNKNSELLGLSKELFNKIVNSKININGAVNELNQLFIYFQQIPKSERTPECYDFLLITLWAMHFIERGADKVVVSQIRKFIIDEFNARPEHLQTSVNGMIPYLYCVAERILDAAQVSNKNEERVIYENFSEVERIQKLLSSLPDNKSLLAQYAGDFLLQQTTMFALLKLYLWMILIYGSVGNNKLLFATSELLGNLFINNVELMLNVEDASYASTAFGGYYKFMADYVDSVPLLSKTFKFAKKLFEPSTPMNLRELISVSEDFMMTITPMQVDLYHHLLLIFQLIDNDIKAGAFDSAKPRIVVNQHFRSLMQVPAARAAVTKHKESLESNRVDITQLNNNLHLMAAGLLEIHALRKEVEALRKQLKDQTPTEAKEQVAERGGIKGFFN